ncbi:MAG: site-2 protease family protein [Chloroflexota bacterium]
MSWSFRIGQVAGIDIKVHLTFFLILLFGAFQFGVAQAGAAFSVSGALFGMLVITLLFVCVVLHELGHSIVAQRFGIPVREILLLPLGGVALLTRAPSKPMQELLIALAGPLVNVVIAAILFVILGFKVALLGFDSLATSLQLQPDLGSLLIWLLYANVMLVAFNMIPAFPLDGGRVLRAVLEMFMTHRRATQIASRTGQGFAVLMAIFAIFVGNILLILVAAFIFFGAGQENSHTQARTVLTTLRIDDAYNKHALTLTIGDRVSKVVDYILTSYQPDFAVMQGHQLIGIVTRNDVLRALSTNTQDLYVTSIMRRDIVQVNCGDTLDEVRQKMAESNVRVVAVYDGEQYLGLVSAEDISEAFAVISFMQQQNKARQTEQAQTNTGL